MRTDEGVPARVREGTPVVDTLGRHAGVVARVIVDVELQGPRLFTVRDDALGHRERLVPCEAIEGVTPEGALRLGIGQDQLHALPAYRGGTVGLDALRRAYSPWGGVPGDPASPEGRHVVPFEDTQPSARLRALDERERREGGHTDVWVVRDGRG